MKTFRLESRGAVFIETARSMAEAIELTGVEVSRAELIEPKATVLYIAGPMTGVKDFNRDKFNLAAADLRRQGFEVRNPADLSTDWSRYEDYIEVSLVMLHQCGGVVLLPGWEKSEGTAGELQAAYAAGIQVHGRLLDALEGQLLPEWL